MKIIITNEHFRKFNIDDLELEVEHVMNIGDSINIISFLDKEIQHEFITYIQGLDRVDYQAVITDKFWNNNNGEIFIKYYTKFKTV